jgi:1-pyrroline-5-carboxylate dehydrogenase
MQHTRRQVVRQISQQRHLSTSTIHRETNFGAIKLPDVKNEPMQHYAPNSNERTQLLNECNKYNAADYKPIEIPCIVNGKEIRTGDLFVRTQPASNQKILFKLHKANKDVIREAIDGALKAKKQWEELPMEHRLAVFLRAAELLSTKYRYWLNGSTMMGQGKTMWQAEIDSACETIDFWRFNAHYASKLVHTQLDHHAPGSWNRLEYRPLEGFVACIAPFNFTAISSNLCSAPAQMGNVCLWKPSENATLSSYYIYKVLQEAGLPDGVIQFVPTSGPIFGDSTLSSEHFAGLHFTGSTKTFHHLWSKIGNNLSQYRSVPRIVGETGGKNYHFVHSSADINTVVNNTIRGAFEYQGQKCSASSRAYFPASLWNNGLKDKLLEEMKYVKVGQPNDPTSFMSAVIDEQAFDRITGFIDRAKNNKSTQILFGGNYSKEKGYFIDPTIILTTDPKYETMEKEIFGPVLTIYVYDDKADNALENTLKLIDETSPYGLTGSIFARDRYVIAKATAMLRNTAGNFYINDKSTGAIVGQQPFGGARISGTNDKAGSEFMLHRWVSIRSIKENMLELKDWGYPSVDVNRR